MCLFCFRNVFSQENNIENKIDTIMVYKGYWSNVDGLPCYPDDFIFLTINHQEDVLFQENTQGHNRIVIMIGVDYIVDTSNIINFKPETMCFKGILSVEDSSGKNYYNCSPTDSEEYNKSFFGYSCLSRLYDFVDTFLKNVKLFSNIHRYEKGKEGTYCFGIYITPNSIECLKKTTEPIILYVRLAI